MNCALDRFKPYQRPKLSDPAHEGVRLQPERDGRVRCSAWLNPAAARRTWRSLNASGVRLLPEVWPAAAWDWTARLGSVIIGLFPGGRPTSLRMPQPRRFCVSA